MSEYHNKTMPSGLCTLCSGNFKYRQFKTINIYLRHTDQATQAKKAGIYCPLYTYDQPLYLKFYREDEWVNPFSARTVFIRQNLPFVDVRF